MCAFVHIVRALVVAQINAKAYLLLCAKFGDHFGEVLEREKEGLFFQTIRIEQGRFGPFHLFVHDALTKSENCQKGYFLF